MPVKSKIITNTTNQQQLSIFFSAKKRHATDEGESFRHSDTKRAKAIEVESEIQKADPPTLYAPKSNQSTLYPTTSNLTESQSQSTTSHSIMPQSHIWSDSHPDDKASKKQLNVHEKLDVIIEQVFQLTVSVGKKAILSEGEKKGQARTANRA